MNTKPSRIAKLLSALLWAALSQVNWAQAQVIANSTNEFSGVQGQDGWFYGYRNVTVDGKAIDYDANADFIPFDASMWTGTEWDLDSLGAAPWTMLGRETVHPNGVNNAAEHWVIRRWVSEVSGRIEVDWTLAKSNPGGNGVSLKLVNWKDEKTPVVLDTLYLEQGRKGTSAIQSEFVVHINPGDLGKHVDLALGNNGNYFCDATAVRLRVYAADQPYETPGVDVTKTVQSLFQGKFRTDLGKYAILFGDPAPGQEKTLKLRVQDLGGNIKYMELPENTPIELP